MSATVPIVFDWTDEGVMRPKCGFSKLCDKQYVVGESYRLEVVEQRSMQSHNHYFAVVEEAWRNLPETIADRWPTAEHLRKWALVQAGYRDEATFVCKTKAEALRFAAFMRSLEEYAVVVVDRCIVTRCVAKSQSLRAMPGKEFQASKVAVLDVLAKLIGVSSEDLKRNAARAA